MRAVVRDPAHGRDVGGAAAGRPRHAPRRLPVDAEQREGEEGSPTRSSELKRLFKEAREYDRLSREAAADGSARAGVRPAARSARCPTPPEQKKVALHAATRRRSCSRCASRGGEARRVLLRRGRRLEGRRRDRAPEGARRRRSRARRCRARSSTRTTRPTRTRPCCAARACRSRSSPATARTRATWRSTRRWPCAFGLPREEALRAITFYAARIARARARARQPRARQARRRDRHRRRPARDREPGRSTSSSTGSSRACRTARPSSTTATARGCTG